MIHFQIRLRHVLETKALVQINENLTNLQRMRLQMTPFKWIVELKERVQISGVLLRELVSRWDERSAGFRVRSRVVPFTTLDVCFGLGLPIVGEPVSFEDNDVCRVRSLFNGDSMTVESILQKLSALNDDDTVDDFCRVYILFAFSVFYFPCTSQNVSNVPMRVLDNIYNLKGFNWGLAIYEFLADSLSRAATHFNEGRNSAQLHISGCVPLLQVQMIDY